MNINILGFLEKRYFWGRSINILWICLGVITKMDWFLGDISGRLLKSVYRMGLFLGLLRFQIHLCMSDISDICLG